MLEQAGVFEFVGVNGTNPTIVSKLLSSRWYTNTFGVKHGGNGRGEEEEERAFCFGEGEREEERRKRT